MIRRIKGEGGYNVIATVLMLVTIFLVIGFGICGLSTMNLNLAGKSYKVTQANNLAEAAVAQVMYHIDRKTDQINTTDGFNLLNLSYIDLDLEKDYDGTQNVLANASSAIPEGCGVDIHFSTSAGDLTASVDNSNNPAERLGPRGNMIPPFSMELYVTVRIRDYQKHYVVWLNRKWEYVISNEKGPVHIVSSMDTTVSPPQFKFPSQVTGDIFSSFNPVTPPPPTPVPEKITICELPHNVATNDYLMVDNRLPSAPQVSYPASIQVGGRLYRKTEYWSGLPTPHLASDIADLGPCENNMVSGHGRLQYGPPTSTPGYDRYLFTNNNNSKMKFSVFNSHINSPFDHLRLIKDTDVDPAHWINPATKPLNVELLQVLIDASKGLDIEPMDFYIKKDGDDGVGPSSRPDLLNMYNQNVAKALAAYGPDNQRWVYFLKSSFDLTQMPGRWWRFSDVSKYAIRDTGGNYYPLVDECVAAHPENCAPSPSDQRFDGWFGRYNTEYRQANFSHYVISNARTEYAVAQPSTLKFNHSVLISKDNIELTRTNIQGENALIQCEGGLMMRTGSISSGGAVGMVVYCDNFYCGGGGIFNGILIAQKAMKIGSGNNGAPKFQVRGGMLVRGDPQDPGQLHSVFKTDGCVIQGAQITYDPAYMRGLNRFGRLRIACWKELD
jgi:hypothetical protein